MNKSFRQPPPIIVTPLPTNISQDSPHKPHAGSEDLSRLVHKIRVDLIDDNPIPARHAYPKSLVDARADEILRDGQLDPIKVRPGINGRYFLIDGKTRVLAFRSHNISTTIDAIIKDVDELTAAVEGFAANHDRDNGCDLDEAYFFHDLMSKTHESQSSLSRRINVSQSKISLSQSFFKLPNEALKAILASENPKAVTYNHIKLMAPHFESLGKKVTDLVISLLENNWTRSQFKEAIDVALNIKKEVNRSAVRQFGPVSISVGKASLRLDGLNENKKNELLMRIEEWLDNR
ncbi:ParB/RepB/Spo0J family partition protein [Chitinimonas sp. PSY-7]|uniref:ParB/RepB/Spo0J family partition protein n=1 Tax=Chitinimonas sp. PSY-7 TaxID=3459088 RepID=UPI0040400088